jgi:hypothetical protein
LGSLTLSAGDRQRQQSWLISEALFGDRLHPKVEGLVYGSALSPDAGETTAQQCKGFSSPREFVGKTQEDG